MNINKLLHTSEQEAFLTAIHSHSDRSVRLHVSRSVSSLPFATIPVPWNASGRFLVDSSLRPAAFLQYATADYYIQDAGSLLPVSLLDPQPGETICDLCASPGGKASAIVERLGSEGFLLANESIRSRVDVLKYALARTGNPSFAVCSYDPEDLARLVPQAFDAVLVDAPCSGQMLVGRSKRDTNAFSENQIEHCAQRQQRILQSAIRLLKPGGRLIYSTCTFAEEENESQIQWLQDQSPGSWLPLLSKQLEPWQSPRLPGCYRLWPHRDKCAGGFAAGLRLINDLDSSIAPSRSRAQADRETQSKSPFNSSLSRRELEQRSAKAQSMLQELGNVQGLELRGHGGQLQAIAPGAVRFLSTYSLLSTDSLSLVIETGNHWVPTHGLSFLDRRYFEPFQVLELATNQAIPFANGVSIPRDPTMRPSASEKASGHTSSAWVQAVWQGRPLGWCKALSNRLNNHIPPWARLNLA